MKSINLIRANEVSFKNITKVAALEIIRNKCLFRPCDALPEGTTIGIVIESSDEALQVISKLREIADHVVVAA